ncbi:DUF3536 domain-containing protein, partial [Myxococcota bacterium]|nr:DUF3536 domain-containing protein [Myxococcota bacterium]
HRYGEMGLAWTLHLIENDPEVSLINYGQYLELHPPEWEAQIVEKSSWSCAHGVERWRSDCGCNSGANPQWRQAWRAPLRRSLDWLRDRAVELFVSQGDGLFVDPWAARDAYISVIFDRSNENQDKFLSEHLKDELTSERRINALRLLEIQRHAQLMFTSCGWFFDDVAGIETTQVLQYAARVIQLYEMISNLRVEKEFIRRLKNATGNRVQFPDGAAVYEKQVLPDRVGLQEVAAHYAVSSLFEDYGKEEDIFGYHVKRMNYNKSRAGRATFAMGTVEVTSQTTQARTQLCFGVLHFGDHNFAGGVHQYVSQKNYGKALQELTDAFERADLPSVVRFLDDHFSGQGFSLDSLFLDEQEKIVGAVLANTVEDLAGVYRQLYESNGPLIRYLSNLRAKLPNALRMAAEYVLSEDLHEAITQPEWDLELIQRLVERAEREHLRLDADLLVPAANAAVASVATRLIQNPQDLNLIQRIRDMIRMLDASPVKIPLQTIQDAYLRARKDDFEEVSQKSSEGHDWATQWLKAFNELGQTLNIA